MNGNTGNFFSRNIKHIRNQNNLTQEEFAKIIEKDRSLIGHWESGNRDVTTEDLLKICNYFNIDVTDILTKDLRLNKLEFIDLSCNTTSIPVLGIIKAGVPIEAQENILEYVDIPIEWTKGDKKYNNISSDKELKALFKDLYDLLTDENVNLESKIETSHLRIDYIIFDKKEYALKIKYKVYT